MKPFVIKSIIFSLLVIAFCGCLLYSFPKDPDHMMAEYEVKRDMISDPSREASIILLGGSGTAFGTISELMEKETGYPVINAGLHASLGQHFILTDIMPFIRKDDILVYSPEHISFHTQDETPVYLLMYAGIKHIGSFSISNIANIIRQTPWVIKMQYLKATTKSSPQDSLIYHKSLFNARGDAVAHWEKEDSVTHFYPTVHSDYYSVNEKVCMHRICNKLKRLHCKVMLVPAPISHNLYQRDVELLEKMDAIFDKHGLAFSTAPQDYYLPDSLFYDTDYHLKKAGAERRTLETSSILKR